MNALSSEFPLLLSARLPATEEEEEEEEGEEVETLISLLITSYRGTDSMSPLYIAIKASAALYYTWYFNKMAYYIMDTL